MALPSHRCLRVLCASFVAFVVGVYFARYARQRNHSLTLRVPIAPVASAKALKSNSWIS